MSSELSNVCVLCDEKCNSVKALDFHVKTVHLRLFVCTKCPEYTTMIKAKLIRHMVKEHKQSPVKVTIKEIVSFFNPQE